METSALLQQLEEEKFLPLYTATSLEYVETAKKVLLKHNLHFIEVTYRSDLASKVIYDLSQSGELIVGAGTVRNIATAKEAVANGAKFIVTPGLDEEIVTFCLDKNIPVIPGAVTPTEIMRANSLGLKVLKFFPADIYGGIKAINALNGPFADIKFVPTGGITKDNVSEFIDSPAVLAVGGSFIISEKRLMIDNGETADKLLGELVAGV